MLKIKAPIALKCTRLPVPAYKGFCERITGNYNMMNMSVSGEELLQLVTTPPEYYLVENGAANILSTINIQNKNQNKLEVLNQFLNRITINSDIPLTYQDNVYITNVLRKLGISDINSFMTQVSQIKEETENTQKLISVYTNRLDKVISKINEYKAQYETKKETTINTEENNPIYLHQEILNRLQTGAVYQTVQNFRSNQAVDRTIITNEQMHMSDYSRLTRNILLNRLENTVRQEKMPLTYYHENYYEKLPIENEEYTEKNIENRITAAIVLQLIDNMYQQKQEKHFNGTATWYYTDEVFYQTVDNTVRRIQNNLAYGITQHRREQSHISKLNKDYKYELELLKTILNEENGSDYSVSYNRKTVDNDITFDTYKEYIEDNSRLDISHQQINNSQLLQSDMSSNELKLIHNVNTSNEENYELLEQQVNEINRINIENRNKYVELMKQLQKREATVKPKNVAIRMKSESLQALTNPQKFLEEHKEKAEKQEKRQRLMQQKAFELLPEDSRRIFEAVENYLNMPEREGQYMRSESNMALLMSDIDEVEKQQSGENRDMVTEPEHMQKVAENINNTNISIKKSNEELVKNIAANILQNNEITVLQDNTSQIFEAVEKYLHMSEQGVELYNEIGDMDILVRDIREVLSYQIRENNIRDNRSEGIQNKLELIQRTQAHDIVDETDINHTVMEKTQSHTVQDIKSTIENKTNTESVKNITNELLQNEQLLNIQDNKRKSFEAVAKYLKHADDIRHEQIKLNDSRDMTAQQIINQVISRQTDDEKIYIHKEEQIKNISEAVLEHIEENTNIDRTVSQNTQNTIRNQVSLIHKKETDNHMDEEIINQLMLRNKLEQNKTEISEETVENTEHISRTVNVHGQHVQEMTDVTELIQRGVRQQMNQISDQVYHKLEKKLQNERKRRGY